jgi:hypothetical protein
MKLGGMEPPVPVEAIWNILSNEFALTRSVGRQYIAGSVGSENKGSPWCRATERDW